MGKYNNNYNPNKQRKQQRLQKAAENAALVKIYYENLRRQNQDTKQSFERDSDDPSFYEDDFSDDPSLYEEDFIGRGVNKHSKSRYFKMLKKTVACRAFKSKKKVTNTFAIELKNHQTISENGAFIRPNASAEEVLCYLLLQESKIPNINKCFIGDDVPNQQTPDIYCMEKVISERPSSKGKSLYKFGAEVRTVEEEKTRQIYAPAVSQLDNEIALPVNKNEEHITETFQKFLDRVQGAINSKFKKLRKGNYSGCDKIYLFIFANLVHKDYVDEAATQKAVFDFYHEALKPGQLNFDALFMCVNNKIFAYTPETVCEITPALDEIEQPMKLLHEMCD